MKKKLIRFCCIVCAVCLIVGAVPFSAAPQESTYAGSKVSGTATLSADSLTLNVNDNGLMTVTDALSGYTWTSNALDMSKDTISYGVNRTRAASQLLISYLGSTIVMETASFEDGIADGNSVDVYAADDVVTAVYHFEKLGFEIPVEYRLNGRKLVVRIPNEKVLETKKNRLVDIGLLPFFGSGNMEEEGFLMVPDGSGAIVRFNNGKTAENRLELDVLYGDRSKVPETKTTDNQPLLMPAFGICHERAEGNATVLGYATSGEWGGMIAANIAGRETAYNYAYYTFLFREYNTETMLDRTYAAKSKLVVDSRKVDTENFEMTYVFGDPSQSGIAAMAAAAKEVLFGETKTETKELPVYLDMIMGVRVKKNFLGIPYKTLQPLTTLSEAQDIVKEIGELGVDEFEVRMQGLTSDGFASGKIDSKLKIDGKLGTAKELSKMITDKVRAYPSVDLTDYNASGNGASTFLDSSYDLLLDTIRWPQFFLASGGENDSVKPDRLLNPKKVEKASDKLIKDLASKKITGVEPSSLAQGVYPDHTRKQKVNIMTTGKKFMNALDKMGEKNNVMLEKPIAEAWNYADAILYLPATSSHYNICDGDVPFLQMVLSGVVTYSTDALNNAGNKDAATLLCIRNGAAPAYQLMAAPYKTVMDTDARDLYAANFEDSKDLINGTYATVSKALAPVYGMAMTDYEVTAEGLQISTYSNGYAVVTNPTAVELNYLGQNIPVNAFITVETEAVS